MIDNVNYNFRNTAKLQSARFRDRPMSAMATATFWVEYTIRNGPAAVKSPAVDLTWWQIELLDVYGFLLASAISLICASIFTLKLIINMILRIISNDRSNLKSSKKHN